MKLEIYQTEKKDFTFFSFDYNDRKHQLGETLDLRQLGYKRVYSNKDIGKAGSDLDLLEKIFILFNRDNRPYAQKMRSLSVSDIVVLDSRAYYCDSLGFRKINVFDSRAKTKEALLQYDK